MSNRKKVKRLQPFTRAWEAKADALARCYAPQIYPCKDCGGPVANGYCCQRCGSTSPEGVA